jgi:alcohol dehydrogenase
MGENLDGIPKKDRSMAFITALKKLINNIGFEEKLSDFGIEQSQLRTFAESSFYTMGSLYDITPVKLTLDDVIAIYENAYS